MPTKKSANRSETFLLRHDFGGQVVSPKKITIPLYGEDGKKQQDLAVSEKIFGLPENQGLIHRLLMMQLGNRRQASAAHTKEKGEVRGGGRKPHAQKHTGRARQGSTRNPHMKGGGVAFGPRNTRNFTTKLNKKERRLALFTCLSSKIAQNKVLALEHFAQKEPKTKAFYTLLKKLSIEKGVLLVLPARDEVLTKSSRNIPRTKPILVNYINPDDILKYEHVLFMKDSLPKLESLFLKT